MLPATPRRKTLFEKNFLDLSVEGGALGRLRCLLRAACFLEDEKLFFEMNFLDVSVDGRRTGMRTAMPCACCLLPEELSRPFCGGRRTGTEVLKGQGCLLCLFCVLPATPRRKTLFEKNFLDLSVEGRALRRLQCLLRAACFLEENFLDVSVDGRRTGMRTAMPSACCLLPEELSRPFCGGRRTGTEVLKGQLRAVCLLGRASSRTACGRSIKGTGTPTMPILCAACHPKKKNFI